MDWERKPWVPESHGGRCPSLLANLGMALSLTTLARTWALQCFLGGQKFLHAHSKLTVLRNTSTPASAVFL